MFRFSRAVRSLVVTVNKRACDKSINKNNVSNIRLYNSTAGNNSVGRRSFATLVRATYIDPDGKRHEVSEPEGTNMLTAAHKNNIDLEGS